MSNQRYLPTTLAEQRARDLSPWRRVFKRRGGRSAWLACLGLAACLGAYSAWSMLHLSVTTPARELLPADPPPTFFVEVRDTARLASIDWLRQDILNPLLDSLAKRPDYGPAVAEALAETRDPWPAIGAALGDDAVLALYPDVETGKALPLAIVATRPVARLELARHALLRGWPTDDGLTSVEISEAGITIHYATFGRLIVASTDPGLARRAIAAVEGGDGFLAADGVENPSLLALRADDQSQGRSGSVYARSSEGETLAEVSLHRPDWSASVWVPGAPTLAAPEAVQNARAEAREVAGASSAVFWHASLGVDTLRSFLVGRVDLTWRPSTSSAAPLSVVVTIPRGEASGAILPELAATALTPAAEDARDALISGAAQVMFQGSRAKATRDADGASVGLPLGFGLRYPVHMAARPGALTFATTKRALTPDTSAAAAPITLSTQRQANLFQLVAEGPALHTLMARTLALMKLASPPSTAVSSASRTIAPLLTRSRTIVASGVSAPDGFRVDVHGSIGPIPAPASAP
jgi:hypothetical protein